MSQPAHALQVLDARDGVAIEAILSPSGKRKRTAEALAAAVDGAIVQAQYGGDPAVALRALQFVADQLAQPG